jgi:hypothetical protein
LLALILAAGVVEAEPLPQCNQYQHYDIRAMKCLPVEAGKDWVKRFEIISTEGNTLVVCTSDSSSSCRVEAGEPLFFCINGDCQKAEEQRRYWRLDQFLDRQEKPSTCEQRMRDAMRQMNLGRVEHGTKGLEDWIVTKMYKADREHWDAVIKDCVHGARP